MAEQKVLNKNDYKLDRGRAVLVNKNDPRDFVSVEDIQSGKVKFDDSYRAPAKQKVLNKNDYKLDPVRALFINKNDPRDVVLAEDVQSGKVKFDDPYRAPYEGETMTDEEDE